MLPANAHVHFHVSVPILCNGVGLLESGGVKILVEEANLTGTVDKEQRRQPGRYRAGQLMQSMAQP